MGKAYGSFVRELNAPGVPVLNAPGEIHIPGELTVSNELNAPGVLKALNGPGEGVARIREAIPRFHDLAYRYEQFVRVVEAGTGNDTFKTTREQESVQVQKNNGEQKQDGASGSKISSFSSSSTSPRHDRSRSMIQDAQFFHCLIDQSQELIARVTYSINKPSHTTQPAL